MRRFAAPAALVGCALVLVSHVYAQRGGGDWMTIGNDAQRSSWVRGDGKISKETMGRPGFQLLWHHKLKNTPTPPALLDFYISYRGFRALGFTSSADGVTGIDIDLDRTEWEKSIGTARPAPGPCPGGITTSVTRPTSAGYPGAGFARGGGRGGAAKSGVGEPNEGAVTIRQTPPAPPPPPPPPVAGRRAAPIANPFGRTPQFVSVITPDGKLHMMYVSNGDEPKPAVPFLPANAHARGLIVLDGVAYVATVNGCGGVPDGVWALDLESRKVSQWKAPAAVVGSVGPAVGPDGTLYVAAGGELVALAQGTLEPKGSYKTGGAKFTSSPVVFDYRGKDLIAASTDDGRLHLLDSSALGGNALAVSPVFASKNYASGSVASWQDPSGTRWVLVPTGTAVAAWKVVDKDGGIGFAEGWVSRELASPLGPAVVNGVVFALSSGEWRAGSSAQRAQNSTRATLYALEGTTGREMWSSGEVMATHAQAGALAAGGGRVYVCASDGTLYAFGFQMEH